MTEVEKIELLIEAPKRDLPGLVAVDKALAAIEGRLAAIQTVLSKPLEFRRVDPKAIAESINTLGKRTGKLAVESVAKALGFDSVELLKFAKAEVAKVKKGAKALFTDASETEFYNAAVAKRAALEFARARASQNRVGLTDLLRYAVAPPLPAAGGGGAGAQPPAHPPSGGGEDVGGGSGGGRGGGTPWPLRQGPAGTPLETRTTAPADASKPRQIRKRFIDETGRLIDYFIKQTADGEESLRRTVDTTSHLKPELNKWQAHMAELRQRISNARGDTGQVAQEHLRVAEAMEKAAREGGILSQLGRPQLAQAARTAAARLRQKAEGVLKREEERDRARWEQHVREELASHADYRAMLKSADDRNLLPPPRQRQRAIPEGTAPIKPGDLTSPVALARTQARAADAAQQRATEQADAAAARAERVRVAREAAALRNRELAAGARLKRDTILTSTGGLTTTQTLTREDRGRVVETTIRFNSKLGASYEQLTRELKATRAEAGLAGADFVRNTEKVASWASNVAILYQTVGLARYALGSFIETGLQTQRLSAVFRGVGGSSQQLAGDVLQLAAIESRGRREALESAIAWSRLGLTRAQVNEATRVSLVAANVAELQAGQATEYLSALYVTYGLRVGQLRSVLGQLNQVSNTQNATNADMLEGLARVAPAAKQAGLGLSELIGIVGATVGATAQSGANIGNAVKTLIARLGDPAMQKILREQFRFEVTTRGGAELDDLGSTLSRLYLKFQELNSVQRASLLTQVVGAHQLNRVTALLDNYVRAQVLAINAQLNLNSAEKENAKIKAALASQLRGVAAEFERFAVIQGGHGPGQALTLGAQTLKNVLSLANTGPGSFLSTGFIALLGTLSAKLALTAFQMDKLAGKGGFVLNTFSRVRASAASLGEAINFGVERFQTSRVGPGIVGPRRLGRETVTGRVLNVLGGGAGILDASSQRRFELARRYNALLDEGTTLSTRWGRAIMLGAVGGNYALGMLNRTAAVTLNLIRATVLTARSLIFTVALPTIAFIGALKLFNLGMESVGASIESTTSKLAGFNERAEAAAAAANAAAQAARLFDTVSQSLDRQSSGKARLELLKQIEEVQLLSGERKKELFAAEQRGDKAAVKRLLAKESAYQRAQESIKRQEEFEANRARQKETTTQINRLKAGIGGYGGLFDNSIRENIAKLEKEQAAATEQNIRYHLEQTNALKEKVEAMSEYQIALAQQKAGLESIAELARQLPTFSREDKLNAELAAIHAQNAAWQEQRQVLSELEKEGAQDVATRQAQLDDLDRQIAVKREAYAADREAEKLYLQGFSKTAAASSGNVPVAPPALPPDLRERLDAYVVDIEQMQKQRAQLQAGPTVRQQAVRQQIGKGDEGQRERDRQAAEKEATRALERVADRRQAILDSSSAELGQFGVGYDEAAKLLDREGRLKEYISQQERLHATAANGSLEAEAAQLRLVTAYVEQHKLLFERQREIYDLRRQEKQVIIDSQREFARSLLTAGPGELLRKIAAVRLAQSGPMNLGRYLAIDPNIREELARLPAGMAFNPTLNDIRRQIRRLDRPATDEALRGNANAGLDFVRDFRERLGLGSVKSLLDTNITRLGEAAGYAASALARIPAIVDQIAGVAVQRELAAGRGQFTPAFPQLPSGIGGARGLGR